MALQAPRPARSPWGTLFLAASLLRTPAAGLSTTAKSEQVRQQALKTLLDYRLPAKKGTAGEEDRRQLLPARRTLRN
jgi:hypothetical protein